MSGYKSVNTGKVTQVPQALVQKSKLYAILMVLVEFLESQYSH